MRNILGGAGDNERKFVGFEACNAALRRICGAYCVEAERWSEFRGSIETHRAGSLEFADVVLSGGRVVRGRDDRHYRGDHVFLILQATGAARMRQCGSDASLRPGDCTLIDSRFPSVFEVGPGFHQYSFHLPAQLVKERFGAGMLPSARTIRANFGAGALLSRLLDAAVRNASTLGGVELTGITLELLAAALCLDANRRMPLQAARRTMSLREITQFIDVRMDSLDLSPASIAVHFNTSVRRLYRLVAAAGWTPASLIWSRRLERARQLLTRDEHHVPIIEVALRCGFKDGAHFSRAYRRAFGHPPKLARSLAVGGSTAEPDFGWRVDSTDASAST
ncbi:MAG TPA: helix-turn-helix domain-containing protein [Steroidobacteraceae bacterium]|nr:helix-turn-helix domain-containing protein [Steroidobacteraceae bacterium]